MDKEFAEAFKEEIELDEFYTVFAVRHKAKDGKRYVIPFKTQQKADKKAKELKSAGATEIEVTKEILKGNIKWKEEVDIDEGSNSKDIANMYALTTKAMKAVPGSSKQAEIIKQLNDVRRRLGKPPLKVSDMKDRGKDRYGVKRVGASGSDYAKEEVEIEEARKAAKDIGLECQECGKRFRSANPRYGVTKCPKCKSTDLDLAYGEEVEIDEVKYRGYDIERQNRKGQHPLTVPAMQIVGADMKDIKRKIDDKIKKNPKLKIEEVELDEKFAGWIAFYNREKYEIKPKKGEIDSLYDAKQAAIKHFRIPKSKQGLLAIKPAHEEVEEARSKEDELRVAKAIAAWKKAGGKVKKLPPGRKFQSLFGKGYKPKKQPRQAEEVVREASTYRDKKYAKKKTGKVPPSQKASRWGQGGYGKEEVEEKRSSTGYELYHKDFSSAMQHAYKFAKSKGHIVDPKEIDDKVATGPKKPSSGKTNRYALKAGRKTVHIQVANLDNKRYELNMYIESIQERYETQSKMFPKVLMDGLTKAIPGVKLYRHSIKHPRSGQKIPGLGLLLSGEKGIRIMVQYDRESEPAPKGMDKTIVDVDPETGKKEVTDTSFRDSYAVWVNDVGKIWKADELRWIQTKDFRDPKKVVQFLKTKVKRMKEEVEEVLDIKNTKMADVIKDFQDSDAPQFKGKSDKKRREMAIAAKLSADRNESVKEDETDDPKSKKKDKINLKPKMDEKMKKYKDLLQGLKERKSVKEDSDKDTPGTQGDNAEWQKKRSEVLKKFGVGSCSALKDVKEKKACYKALDDAHVADHEEQVKKEVKEAVTTGGIEYGEQDWDMQHRLDQAAPYMDSNFAEFYEQGLEGPYIWHGETYFFDRKIGGWYSVTAEDYVDDEISKDLSLAYVKDGMYKRQFAS